MIEINSIVKIGRQNFVLTEVLVDGRTVEIQLEPTEREGLFTILLRVLRSLF